MSSETSPNIIEFFVSLIDNLNRSVELIEWSPNKIEFKTETAKNQFLVMSEIFYPNDWTLNMDNKKYKIYEVNNIVRGIKIPKGYHHFIMEFNTENVSRGLNISRFGLCILIVILLLHMYIKRKNESL